VNAQEQVAGIQQGARVVIATPGRLIGLVTEGKLSLANVIYAVLDEADRMLDMGFEPDVRTIMSQVSQARQTLLFSATWPASVQKLGSEFVSNPFHVLVGSEQLTANHDVAQIVEVTEEDSKVKDKRLLAIMKQYYNKQLKNRILVFVLYKKDVPRVERLLQQSGYGCGSISSDRSQAERIKALEGFRDGSKPVLVGTDVASRGLDIPDVSHVINYSFPLTVEDYIHRIGRTGRSGKKGVSHTFFCKFDKGLAGELVNVLNEAKAEVPADLLKFGTGVKRKEHGMYGLHYKSLGDAPMPASKKVVFS
jgi:ATP-dependent RNA helicase DBP3